MGLWRVFRLLPLMLPAIAAAAEPTGAPGRTAAARGAVVRGRLPNGVRYAILPRASAEPGIGLLMRNEGGFIAERRPGERGLAHLIEHIVLVSPTTTAPDEPRHFIHVGLPLSLPAPSVGTTSWRETNYFVSTRTRDPADLDTLLALFREVATDLTFRADMVDEQRADVVREMAGRKAGNDVFARFIRAVAPGSPNDLLDAQNSDDVPTASVATIRGLYRRLYRPEAMMVVVVGDVDPVRTRAMIARRFGGWRAEDPAPAQVPASGVEAGRIAPISVDTTVTGRRSAMMTAAMPAPPPGGMRRAQADATLMDMLAVHAVRARLAAAQPGAPTGKTGALIENGEQGYRLILLWDHFAPGGWRPAVTGLRRTACALRTAGFSTAEWDAAKQALVDDLIERSRSMAAVPNVELAKDLSHALAAGRALIPADELLTRARAWLPRVNAAAGSRWWARQWREGREHVRVEVPELAGETGAAAAVRSAVDGAVDDPRCAVRG